MDNLFTSPTLPFQNETQTSGDDLMPIDLISEFDADMTILKICELDNEINSMESIVKKEITYIQQWSNNEMDKLLNKRAYLIQVLDTYMLINNKKRLNLPHGRASYRKQPYKIDVKDEKRLIKQGYSREVITLDKKSIIDQFKTTGEIPEGCDIIRDDDKLYVKPAINGKD